MFFMIFSRLVISCFVVAGGLLTLGAGLLAYGIVVASFRADPERQEFHIALDEALCDVTASIADPAGIGLARRLASLTVVDAGNTIDFRALPERWRTICLTSVNSGQLSLSRIADDAPHFRLQRPLCFGWSEYTIAVVVVDEHNVAFPFQLKVRDMRYKAAAKLAPVISREDFAPCAPRDEARAARCVAFTGNAENCSFTFPRASREIR